jgi:hypothetical protein
MKWNFVALIKKLEVTHFCKVGGSSKSKIGRESVWLFQHCSSLLRRKTKYNQLLYVREARKQ